MMTIAWQVFFVMVVFIGAYNKGYSDGMLTGRKAVRAFYEKRDKARL